MLCRWLKTRRRQHLIAAEVLPTAAEELPTAAEIIYKYGSVCIVEFEILIGLLIYLC